MLNDYSFYSYRNARCFLKLPNPFMKRFAYRNTVGMGLRGRILTIKMSLLTSLTFVTLGKPLEVMGNGRF